MYFWNRDLFSSTKSQIQDKEKREQVKVIILYKSVMKLNTFLFGPVNLKIGRSRFGQAKVASTYVHALSQ